VREETEEGLMLRPVNGWLLRLHPARFRERFGEEMLSIFDCARPGEAARLIVDAFISLIRQWAFRPAFWHERAIESAPWTAQRPPAFYIFQKYKLRGGPLLAGAMLTTIAFTATWLVSPGIGWSSRPGPEPRIE
jgi:hypothetical protein